MAAAATMTAPFRSLEAATSMPLPGKVHGAQVLKSIAPWRQCQARDHVRASAGL